jgi:hypothetical protein
LLEEESYSYLHDALTGFAQDSAEGGIVHIVVDLVEIRVIENVLRLEAKLEVTGALRGQRKLFQQRGVGKEAAGIPHVGEDKRCVAEAEIRRPR